MQFFRQSSADDAMIVSWGVRVMLLCAAGGAQGDKTAVRIAGLCGQVDLQSDACAALEALVLDSRSYGLVVVECDALGGLTAAQSWLSLLHNNGVPMPVILLSAHCIEQEFPNDPKMPVILRAPVSAVALRVGFQHALRDRLLC